MAGKAAYIADSPLLLDVRWLRMELSLSVAMIYEGKEEKNKWRWEGCRRKKVKLKREGCGEEHDRIIALETMNEPRSTFGASLLYGNLCVPKKLPAGTSRTRSTLRYLTHTVLATSLCWKSRASFDTKKAMALLEQSRHHFRERGTEIYLNSGLVITS